MLEWDERTCGNVSYSVDPGRPILCGLLPVSTGTGDQLNHLVTAVRALMAGPTRNWSEPGFCADSYSLDPRNNVASMAN